MYAFFSPTMVLCDNSIILAPAVPNSMGIVIVLAIGSILTLSGLVYYIPRFWLKPVIAPQLEQKNVVLDTSLSSIEKVTSPSSIMEAKENIIFFKEKITQVQNVVDYDISLLLNQKASFKQDLKSSLPSDAVTDEIYRFFTSKSFFDGIESGTMLYPNAFLTPREFLFFPGKIIEMSLTCKELSIHQVSIHELSNEIITLLEESHTSILAINSLFF